MVVFSILSIEKGVCVMMEFSSLNGVVKVEILKVGEHIAVGRAFNEREEQYYGRTVTTVIDVLHENVVIKNASGVMVIDNTVASDDSITDVTESMKKFFENIGRNIEDFEVEHIAEVAALLDAIEMLSEYYVNNRWHVECDVSYIYDADEDNFTFKIVARVFDNHTMNEKTSILIGERENERFEDIVEMLEAVCEYLSTQQENDSELFNELFG